MKLGTFDQIGRALAAATCTSCGKRLVAINTAGRYQRPQLDIPLGDVCTCGRTPADAR